MKRAPHAGMNSTTQRRNGPVLAVPISHCAHSTPPGMQTKKRFPQVPKVTPIAHAFKSLPKTLDPMAA